MAITLDSPVAVVLGAHKKAERFTKGLGLRTVGDLLHHTPRRYVPTSAPSKADSVREGEMLTVVGEVLKAETGHGPKAARFKVVVAVEGGTVEVTYFARNAYKLKGYSDRLQPGARAVFIGKVGFFRDVIQLASPETIIYGASGSGSTAEAQEAELAIEELGAFFPVYPLTAGLRQIDVLRAVRFALTMFSGSDELVDILPESLRAEHRLPGLRDAFELIHRPASYADVERARKRFRFEEALTLQLVLGRRRREQRAQGATARTGGGGDLLERFDARLPFTLTEGQREVGAEIEHDLAQPHPMHRLLQGEVGSGKTLVALRAMLRVVDSGGQAVLLAPTEVLAQQHHRSLSAMLGDLAGGGLLGGSTVELLTGSMTKGQRAPVLSRIITGEAGIVVGTHALLQEQVQFADLGLVVVDEQHRFGVEQRAALTAKAAAAPHVLVMTATPIPRTVAMTVFGDLEVSTLAGLPAGRAPIQSTLVPLAEQPHWMDRVWARVREEVDKGHQAYVVAPRISGDQLEAGEADALDLDEEGEVVTSAAKVALSAVDEVAAMLTDGPLKGLRVAVLHGRLPPEEKERTMRDFASGDVDVLVSTTVIEVGVDVHNATAMVILDADRFGVSQLHQLRGRVGRGGLPGLCLLVSTAERGTPAWTRLEAVAGTTDGFALSRLDLEQRREGDVLGASQSGYRSSLDNLRVLRDEETIVQARAAAEHLLDIDVGLHQVPGLRDAVSRIEHSAAADFLEKS